MSSKYLIASYTHKLNGKHTTLGGPAVALAKYLKNKAYCIWQPIEPNKPQWYYWLMKLRDIIIVLGQARPAKVFIGVESINAILGKLLGYPKVIYWNLDYSKSRGWLWLALDRLAIKLADEVWTLGERGFKTVPIGCWFDEIKRNKKRNKYGVVYIGLLQDGQGVELLLNWFNKKPNNWRLTIIGTGKDEEKYWSMADHRVRFTGIISDKSAQEIMCENTWGWDIYHPDNPTHKTTPPTKPMTYMSCGLRLLSNKCTRSQSLAYAKKHDWRLIFKNALNSNTDN